MIAIAGRREQGLSAHNAVCQVLSSVNANKDVSVCCGASQNQPLHPLPLCATLRGCYFPELLPKALCLTEQLTWRCYLVVFCVSLYQATAMSVDCLGQRAVLSGWVWQSFVSTSQTSNLQANFSSRVDGLFQKGAAEFCSRLNETDSASCSQWDTKWRDSHKGTIKYWCGFPGKFLPKTPYGRWSIVEYSLDCFEIGIRLFPNKICPKYSHEVPWLFCLVVQCGWYSQTWCHRLPSCPSF